MPFSSLVEAESYISGLDEETKHRLVTTISFMLINNINQQNNLEVFSLTQKMAALLSTDAQKQLLSEVNSVVVKHLFKSNIDVFPIIHKLSSILNDENKEKIVNDIGFIVQNTVVNKINITATQPGSLKDESIKPLSNNHNAPPPAPFGTHTITRHIQQAHQQPKNYPPPPPLPASIANKAPTPNISSGLTLTGTFNLKPRDSVDKDSQKATLSISETIKNIVPFQTEMGRNALNNISTPTEIYQFLKVVDGKITLENIYKDLYSKLDFISFVNRIYACYHPHYITLKKLPTMPYDKELRLRTGEWLVMLGYLEEGKLDRIVQLHSVAVRNNEVNNRRFAVKTIINGQPVENKGPLFGAFLIESEVITKEQLNQALMVQTQYNEIIAAIK